MGDGTKENPYTREDVLIAIEKNGGTAEGLDLSGKWFEPGINLQKMDLYGIILRNAHMSEDVGKDSIHTNLEGAGLGHAHLEQVDLSNANLKWADLHEARIERALLYGANLEGANLLDAHLNGAILRNARLNNAHLFYTHFEGAFFSKVQFSPETELEESDWGSYILGEETPLDNYLGGTGAISAARVYRRLKQWYTNAGIYDVAGKFFYREMEASRKALSWKRKPLSKLWSWMLRLLCGYGEKPERTVVSASVIIFGLAAAYHFWGSFDTSSVWDMLYYSAVSFTAVGYGNWAPQPTGWAKGAGVAEAFLGVFMMALFLVTFTRKMTR